MTGIDRLTAVQVQKLTRRTATTLFGSRQEASRAAGHTTPWSFAPEDVAQRLAAEKRTAFLASATELLGQRAGPAAVADAGDGARGVASSGAARRAGRIGGASFIAFAGTIAVVRGVQHLRGGSDDGAGARGEARSSAKQSPEPEPEPPALEFPVTGSADESRLRQKMDATAAKDPRGAITNYLVWDLDSGAVQAGRDTDLVRAPASVAKLFTALAVLDEYGPDHRFSTEALRSGQVADRALQGDLVLRGSGDPSLGDAAVTELAQAVKAAGIDTVQGDLVVDDSAFDQEWYADAHPEWYRHGGEVEAIGALRVVGSGAADPGQAAGDALRAALLVAGVQVTGTVRRGSTPEDAAAIGAHKSEELSVLVDYMVTESDNEYAETLIQQVGRSGGGQGSTDAGVAAERVQLERLGVQFGESQLRDGSGLANSQSGRADVPGNAVRLDTVAGVLQAGYTHKDPAVRDAFVASLAEAGRNGTLAKQLTDLDPATQADVRGKTGTLRDTVARAGYVFDADGRKSGYVMIANGEVAGARDLFNAYTHDVVDVLSPAG